ncbi:hypothetical protein ACQPYK_08595 [Streptosporangium sp. CA-135522]|uniref:hypothetical protein n=1 Tax=Streptosporangium sp. CA-135522 TaxID=3240072 RepID=UPI003D8EEA65
MSDTPYLVAAIRMNPEHRESPGYRSFWQWLLNQHLENQGYPIGTYSTITVYIDPLQGVIDVYDLTAAGERVDDGVGGYVTHEVPVTLVSQPQNSGTINDAE